MRVLVTGSRGWADWETIYKALAEVMAIADGPVTLVHGDCPIGADSIAAWYGKCVGWKIEPHPAEWDKYKKRAGFIRNIEMVKAGADICLAFIKDS